MKKIVEGITYFLEFRKATEVVVTVYDQGFIGDRLIPFTKQVRVIFDMKEKRYRWDCLFDDQMFNYAFVMHRFKEDFQKFEERMK